MEKEGEGEGVRRATAAHGFFPSQSSAASGVGALTLLSLLGQWCTGAVGTVPSR